MLRHDTERMIKLEQQNDCEKTRRAWTRWCANVFGACRRVCVNVRVRGWACACACACVCACASACAYACVSACACVRARVCVRARAFLRAQRPMVFDRRRAEPFANDARDQGGHQLKRGGGAARQKGEEA
eukprot:2022769-Pleurochrysis_carterae.AAC.1